MSLANLLNLIERIGNLLRSEERRLLKPLELLPIHLDILYYLSICNKYSNNAAALRKYLGNTKGTTSQSINVLEEKGYVLKKKAQNDKRLVNLHLTEKAFGLLKKLSSESSQKILDRENVEVAEDVLRSILRSIQTSNENRTFGVCRTCGFFIDEGSGSLKCGLTREKLLEYETEQICQEHEPASYAI